MTFDQLGDQLPLHDIKVNALHPMVQKILSNHGCTIEDKKKITYPQGTTRQEILWRTSCVRIQVKLPDGVEVRETESPQKGMDIAIVTLDEIGPFTEEEYQFLVENSH